MSAGSPLPAGRRGRLWLVFLASEVLVGGCEFKPLQPDIGVAPVRGRVTVNGAPQAGIEVYFQSSTTRPSSAITDADGRYVLRYDEHHLGASVGSHVVKLTRNVRPALDPKPELPAKYNSASELKVMVQRGDNVFDFDVIDPAEAESAAK